MLRARGGTPCARGRAGDRRHACTGGQAGRRADCCHVRGAFLPAPSHLSPAPAAAHVGRRPHRSWAPPAATSRPTAPRCPCFCLSHTCGCPRQTATQTAAAAASAPSGAMRRKSSRPPRATRRARSRGCCTSVTPRRRPSRRTRRPRRLRLSACRAWAGCRAAGAAEATACTR
ncbi:MAG: hypothetical protein J3K34DRAFT_403524 [Monoraphidium minutum]|nr:MAG: hypothetical protein J3K34DRAFT_403524 [Monoraphidium minutum]